MPSYGSSCIQQIFSKNLHFLFIAIPHSPHPPTYTSHNKLISEAVVGQEWVKAAHLSGTEKAGLAYVMAPAATVFLLILPGWRKPPPPQPPLQLPSFSGCCPRQMRTIFRLASAPAAGNATQTPNVCVCVYLCMCGGSGGWGAGAETQQLGSSLSP